MSSKSLRISKRYPKLSSSSNVTLGGKPLIFDVGRPNVYATSKEFSVLSIGVHDQTHFQFIVFEPRAGCDNNTLKLLSFSI